MNKPQFASPFGVAFIRGVYSALVTGGITTLTTLQVAGDGTDALIIGAITFLTTLAARTGVEGYVDTKRAAI